MADPHPLVTAAATLLALVPVEGEDRGDGDIVRDGLLQLQRCDRCGFVRYPVAPRCPECLTPGGTWTIDSGLGTVWSYCVYYRAFHPAFRDALPYQTALIELDSGPRLISNVLGITSDDLQVNLRVKAIPLEVVPGRMLVYFEAMNEDERPRSLTS